MYNTRFVIAIYGMIFYDFWEHICHYHAYFTYNVTCIFFSEAICNNRYFEKPTRSEFQAQMREALRTAKGRLQSKIRGPRKQPGDGINRNFWNDERLIFTDS